jgi:hypothetical protein
MLNDMKRNIEIVKVGIWSWGMIFIIAAFIAGIAQSDLSVLIFILLSTVFLGLLVQFVRRVAQGVMSR